MARYNIHMYTHMIAARLPFTAHDVYITNINTGHNATTDIYMQADSCVQ